MARLLERKEAEARRLDEALSALARARSLERNRRRWLADLLDRGGVPADPGRLPPVLSTAARLVGSCETTRERRAMRELLPHLERYAERLLEAQNEWGANPFHLGILNLARQRKHWIRPVATWRPSSWNASRQFSQLARHLLARYPVPEFMDTVLLAWQSDGREHWFRHLGQGGSIRTAPGMTVPLTKRMAHCFTQAPDDLTPVQAVRWGEVRALGGTPRVAGALNATTLGNDLWPLAQEEWLVTVIRWFVQQPMLDPVHVGPILGYVVYRRQRDRDFVMPGRTPNALLGLMAEENQRRRERQREDAQREERTGYRYREFPRSGFRPGIWEIGRGAYRVIWTIEEILCNRDLRREGREMRHCVATYEDSILEGECSIWSMQVERRDGLQRAVTIEVHARSRSIVECRGKCNRSPNPDERQLLDRWAKENGLEVRL